MKTATLIIASSESDSNLYYATRFQVPDPVVYFEAEGKKHLMLPDLEIDRARTEASVDRILSLSDLAKKIKKRAVRSHPVMALLVNEIFREKKIRRVVVPAHFPARYFQSLKKLGYTMVIKPDPFYEGRLIKKKDEKKYIKQALSKVGRAIHEAWNILEKSKIKNNRIYHGRELVTSELLRGIINTSLMQMGLAAQHTIVSSGKQASLPHHHGSGPIFPHTPIIFDIFPRDTRTLYWADMTRTVVKGKPSDTVKKMYKAVYEANRCARDTVKAGIATKKVHDVAVKTLEKYGFKTGKLAGRMQGFIHSTGHGLGLDVHEPPSVSTQPGKLKKGNIITIEPGLYYEKHGGIRLEDVVYVTSSGCELLTKIPKFLEIDKG